MASLAFCLVLTGSLEVILEFGSITFLLVSLLMTYANFKIRHLTSSSVFITITSLIGLLAGTVLIFYYEISTNVIQNDPFKASKLIQASTHWFRHTGLTHQLDSGIDLRFVNMNARHSKMETTSIYLHAEDDDWHQEMSKHELNKGSNAD